MLVTQDVALAQAAPIFVVENPGTTTFEILFVDGRLIAADGLRFTHGDWRCFGHATGPRAVTQIGCLDEGFVYQQSFLGRHWVEGGASSQVSATPLAIQGCAALCKGGNCLSRRDPSQSW